jgi:hypothetical protein
VLERVLRQQRDDLAGTHPQIAKPAAKPCHANRQLSVGDTPFTIDHGGASTEQRGGASQCLSQAVIRPPSYRMRLHPHSPI